MKSTVHRYERISCRHPDGDDQQRLSNSSSLKNIVEFSSNLCRLIRRLLCSFFIRCVIYVFIAVYCLMFIGPLKNIQSFVPQQIEETKRFLVVVAHPDDESLFFSPTILRLISMKKLPHLLVISKGNNDGLGTMREKELNGSCRQLGIELNRCLSLNISGLEDNPHQWWSPKNLSLIVEHYIELFEIDLLITFDHQGISGHLNHRSLSYGIEYYLHHSRSRKPLCYQLKTIPLLFKFTSLFNLLPTLLQFLPRLLVNLFSSPSSDQILFVNSPQNYFNALKSFYAHRSQLRWFRHLYTTFSQYMFINQLIQFK